MHLTILDLDETLVHSCSEWIGRHHDFIAGDSMIFVRPYAIEFILALSQISKIAIWTSSYGLYTTEILDNLIPKEVKLEFIWDRNKCDLSESKGVPSFTKNLDRLRRLSIEPCNYTIVDDKPECIIPNTESVLGVKPYFGGKKDNHLKIILEKLKKRITKQLT